MLPCLVLPGWLAPSPLLSALCFINLTDSLAQMSEKIALVLVCLEKGIWTDQN
jgi:hypothetical protein